MTITPEHVTNPVIFIFTPVGWITCLVLSVIFTLACVTLMRSSKPRVMSYQAAAGNAGNSTGKNRRERVEKTLERAAMAALSATALSFFAWISVLNPYAWTNTSSPFTGQVVTKRAYHDAIARDFGLTYNESKEAFISHDGDVWITCKTPLNRHNDGFVYGGTMLTCTSASGKQRVFHLAE